MAGKINKKLLRAEVLNNREVKRAVRNFAQQYIDTNKDKLINEFENHPVTQELQGGETARNISNTLGGYGNLFSFIGFQSGTDPIARVLNLLRKTGKVKKVSAKNDSFIVSIDLASKEDFENISKMPWDRGRSWLFDIEKTISGLSAYLYGKFLSSRSGGGVQSSVNYSNRQFKRVNYFGTMYDKFIKKLNK